MYGYCKDCDACGEPLYIWKYDDGTTEGVYSAFEDRGGKSVRGGEWMRHVKSNKNCRYNQRC